MYQMYSVIILSVNRVRSKFSRTSILLIVLFLDVTAKTWNLAELLDDHFLFCFNNRELHIFVVMGLELTKFIVILICYCVEGAKIRAMFQLLPTLKKIKNGLGFRLKSLIDWKGIEWWTVIQYGSYQFSLKQTQEMMLKPHLM